MGHLTCLDVFSFKKTKKHIECYVNEVARKEGDYGTELPMPIRWCQLPQPIEVEACKSSS